MEITGKGHWRGGIAAVLGSFDVTQNSALVKCSENDKKPVI